MTDRGLFGKEPNRVLAPSTIDEAQSMITDAAGCAIVPWGGGTRQDLGYAPERYDFAITTRALTQVVDCRPDDLTITAQGGMTISAVNDLLRVHAQMLPFDVALPDRQTVGGAIATRADSYRRFGHGSLRDALLGVDVVNDRGERIKAGGRVVKNVSGYDLPKLYCGSLGTLGLIVEATFRTAPIPEHSATVVVPLPAERNSEEALDAILAAPLEPVFVFLLGREATRSALEIPDGEPDSQCILIGLDGARESVEWQAEAVSLPHVVAADVDAARLRSWLRDYPLAPAEMSAAFHIQSSQVGAFTRMVEWTAGRSGFAASVVADAAVGMMWAQFRPDRDGADWTEFYPALQDKALRCGGSFIVERMPQVLRDAGVPVWLPVLPDVAIMRRVKEALDPSRMWNPGRFFDRI